MRVLILSVTAGGGHNSTAEAIRAYLDAKGIDTKVLDTFDSISRPLSKTISEGYLLVTSKAKFAYGEGYRLAEKREPASGNKNAIRVSGALLSKKIKKYIDIYDPDAIIYTHVFAGILIDVISQKYGLRAKTVGILTDFAFHPYWEEVCRSDFVVTASENLLMQAVKNGFKKRQVLPLGIPINAKFAAENDKKAAKESLGLDPGKPCVLLMGGSMGYGDMVSNFTLLDNMEQDFSIIVVCGSNKKQYDEISSLNFKKDVRLFGFTNKVDELMDASELIVTKPGGLTTSEALAKRLPIIIVNPIPGQEDRNTEFLLNNGVACKVTETYPLDEAVYNVICNAKHYRSMKARIDQMRRPNSTADICEYVIALCEKSKKKVQPKGTEK